MVEPGATQATPHFRPLHFTFFKRLALVILDVWSCLVNYIVFEYTQFSLRISGDVAQMVERALRMREVKGSMPFFSIFFRE